MAHYFNLLSPLLLVSVYFSTIVRISMSGYYNVQYHVSVR